MSVGEYVFNPLAPQMYVDPYPHYAWMREHEPVHQSPVGFTMLFRHRDVARILNDPTMLQRYEMVQTLRSGPSVVEEPYYQIFRRAVLLLDEPEHRRVRLLFAKSFTPKQLQALRADVVRIARELVEDGLAEGGMDLIDGLAFRLPTRVVGSLLGIPECEQDWVGQLAHKLDPVFEFLPMDAPTQAAANAAAVELSEYFERLAVSKRAQPADDLLTQMVQALDEHETLTMPELTANASFLYVAGHETTSGATGLSILALHRNPNQWQRLLDEPGLRRGAVDELLRYDTSGQATARIATEDVVFGDVEVKANTAVVGYIGSAHRDPAKYVNPDRLDVGRKVDGLQAFAGGTHFCLGAQLARMELEVQISTLLDLAPDMRLETLDPPFRDTALMRGLKSLHAKF